MAGLIPIPMIISPEITELVKIIVILLLSFVAAKVVSRLIKILGSFAAKTQTTLDDEVLECIDRPIDFFFVLGGFYLALLSVEALEPYYGAIGKAAFAGFTLIAAWTISRVANTVVNWYSEKISKRKGKKPLGFVKKLLTGFIFIAALIVILQSYGVEIGPLIAGLGVAGLAVALAVKDTLENFFAGIYILVDKPIRIGQTIQCSAGKGTVEDIGWRSVKMRTWENNLIIIPNAKLANDNITNYSTPEKSLVVVNVGVDYSSNPEKVEKVLLDIAKVMIKRNKLDIKEAGPYVRFNKFGDSSLEFSLRFRVPKYGAKFKVAHDTRMEIFRTFKKKRINIPFQTLTVHMEK